MQKADLGDGEMMNVPFSDLDTAPFFFCCAVTAIFLIQVAVPWIRKLYVWCFRLVLGLFGVREQKQEKTQLLAQGTAWLIFAHGACLLPLCFVLYDDTFRPPFGEPFEFGLSPFFAILFVAPLMFVCCIEAVVWIWRRWRKRFKNNE